MAKFLNKLTGQKGEEEARKLLRSKGYKVLESNFATRFGEIDVIAVHKSTLVFVEVKAKVGELYGSPEEMINRAKYAQIKKTAEMYILKNAQIKDKYDKYRIDAVTVVFGQDHEITRINHYENIEVN